MDEILEGHADVRATSFDGHHRTSYEVWRIERAALDEINALEGDAVEVSAQFIVDGDGTVIARVDEKYVSGGGSTPMLNWVPAEERCGANDAWIDAGPALFTD